ncbi:MAG TPA: glycine oxidase ThiO [Candidatus Baltobacteraceae bacterium]|nr:glycine oxidase ThiO [Candidatus Baltobacteraceae bacterium]
MHESGDVAIIGAGIIGLAVAFELAGRGANVRVFDTSEPARAASWAAAGMLAPRTEHLRDDAMRNLCESSLAAYPEFVQAIREAGGVDPHLRLDGILHTAYSAQAFQRLQTWAGDLLRAGYEATLLARDEALRVEPALGKHLAGALIVSGEGQIDNRRLGRSLIAACKSRGVRIHTDARMLSLECDARRVLGVRSEVGYVAAGAVINAAGAWAARVEGAPTACMPPVYPVKGEMLAIEVPLGFIRHTTWIPHGYLVPRADGRLLVGATSVEAGFDARVTAGGVQRLLRAALEALPALAGFTVSETWAGLRPGTRDERPFLGATPLAGYFLACGHYRNGILLAAITARLLADAIEHGRPISQDFALDRPGTKLASA